MNDDAGALGDYNAAVARSPHAIVALRKRAPLLAKMGRKNDAIADYRDMLDNSGDFLGATTKAQVESALIALGANP